jgi:hypothetical protein
MRLATLVRTPRPAHVFALDEGGMIYGRHGRQRDALERVERQGMAPGWYQLGPVGVLQIERQPVADALAALLPQLDPRPTRASVVVPNGWVRYLVLDLEALPRQREEAEDVLRWRLKKLLPCRPEDVRLDYLPLGRAGRVFVELALDRPLAALEGAFESAGVAVGCIEPAVMALTALVPAEAQPALLVVVEERTFALVVMAHDRVLLARQKSLPGDEQRAGQQLSQELARTLAHVREQEELAGELTLWVAPPDQPAAAAAAEWAAGQDGVAVRRLTVGDGRLPALPPLPALPLWAMLATSWGGTS